MPTYLSKFLCYLFVSLQVLTSIASAQGLMLCVPASGAAHIENRTQQQNCSQESKLLNDAGKVSLSDSTKRCLDLPVGGSGQGAIKPAQQLAQFDAAQFIAILPQFLQITLDPFAPATTPRAEANADSVPDTALHSLGSVILVI